MGLLDGVVATRPGWLERMEVVEVRYDPRRVTYENLVRQAAERECAAKVFVRTDEQEEVARRIVGERAVRSGGEIRTDDDKYYLSRTPLKHLPLTALQATVVNAWVGEREDPSPLLAPSQRRLLETIRAHPDAGWDDAIGKEFLEAWAAATKTAAAREEADPAEPVEAE